MWSGEFRHHEVNVLFLLFFFFFLYFKGAFVILKDAKQNMRHC